MRNPDEIFQLLSEQIAYYRAIATEYEDHSIPSEGQLEMIAAVDAFRPTGHVLEFACGFGAWTSILLGSAMSVTAVDAAPEMLARAKARIKDGRVQFVHADIFKWKPDRRYNEIFFVDDNYRTPQELIEGETSATVLRRLNDGTAHRAVKVPHRSDDLEERLKGLGWNFKVTQSVPFGI